jgi:hypothetical protein
MFFFIGLTLSVAFHFYNIVTIHKGPFPENPLILTVIKGILYHG